MKSNLTDGAWFTFADMIELDGNLALALGVSGLLTVKVEGFVVVDSSSRVATCSGVGKFAFPPGFVDKVFSFCKSTRGLAFLIERTSADVEVDPVTGVENLKVSQSPFGFKSLERTKRRAGVSCIPFNQVVDGNISGRWECERRNNKGEESGDDGGEFHVG